MSNDLGGEASRPPDAPGSGAEEQSLDTPVGALPSLVVKALRIHTLGYGAGWELRPSPARRHWMDQASYAYMCVPLVMANQWGWQVLCPTDVRVIWNGSAGPEGVRVEVDEAYAPAIVSQFGTGIVTFAPPWLFRTSPGWDLYAKGPSNRWKPNCFPLEGIIETWWLNYTFTLNWKLVEPGAVTFAKGESLAQLVPVPHGTFVAAEAIETPIEEEEPAVFQQLAEWVMDRQRRATQPNRLFHRYRKAEEVEGHLNRVTVPPFTVKTRPKDGA